MCGSVMEKVRGVMQQHWTRRVKAIESFKVMDLLKRAKELDSQGCDVIHMEAGEPDFPTPEPIRQAAHQAIDRGLTQYTPAAGIPELRQAIAAFYQQRYQLPVDPQQVIVTAGASAALLMVFALLAESGSQIMMADPGYPCNRQFLRLMDASPQLVPTGAAENFQLTPELIAQHWQASTVGVLLASPANPTGAVLDQAQLQAVAAAVQAQQGVLVVDELYHGLTYGMDAPTVLSVDRTAFVINSFSKYFGMTGWRLGWIVAPPQAVPELEKLAQNLYISPPTVSQYAALAAFDATTLAELEQRRQQFQQRRDLLVAGLRRLGFGIEHSPQGAFYVYADAAHLSDDTFALCWHLLETEHIAVTPGLDFGQHQAQRFIRFSYTTGLDRIEQMLQRLERYIQAGSSA